MLHNTFTDGITLIMNTNLPIAKLDGTEKFTVSIARRDGSTFTVACRSNAERVRTQNANRAQVCAWLGCHPDSCCTTGELIRDLRIEHMKAFCLMP